MPVTYDLESGVVYTKCAGNVTFEEVLAHFRKLEADTSLPPLVDVLLDLTGMESLPETDQLRSVAIELDHLQSKVKWGGFAIVADRDALYGMTRMFQVFAEDLFSDSCVFRDRAEAERWLGTLSPPAS